MKKRFNRLLSLLLVGAMVLTSPAAALAAEPDGSAFIMAEPEEDFAAEELPDLVSEGTDDTAAEEWADNTDDVQNTEDVFAEDEILSGETDASDPSDMEQDFSEEDGFSIEAVEELAADAPVPAALAGSGTSADPYLITAASELPQEIPAGEFYALANDLVLEPGQQIKSLAGTLDGRGHRITLADLPLAENVTGVMQNLGTAGSITISNDYSGAMADALSGTMQNCWSVVDVTLVGWTEGGGLVGTLDGGVVRNSYYAGPTSGYQFGSLISKGSNEFRVENCYTTASVKFNFADSTKFLNCEIIDANDLKSVDCDELLNNDSADTGLVWANSTDGSNNGFPVLVPPSASEEVDKSGLLSLIEQAKQIENANYTDATWNAFCAALEEAQEAADDENASKADVKDAVKKLTEAMSSLEKKKPTAPVAPKDASSVIEIASLGELESQIGSGKTDAYYRLTSDLTVDGSFWGISSEFNGVLDGNGHTIRFADAMMPLFTTVGTNGVIQNTYFTGDFGGAWQTTGPAAANLYGTIVNCYTDVTGDFACGFAAKMLGSACIANSYSVSEGGKGAFVSSYGTGTESGAGTLIRSYWRDLISNAAIPAGAWTDSYAMPTKAMKTSDFVDLLNSGCGEYGTGWGMSSNGYPYFGEDQEYDPSAGFEDNSYNVIYTPDLDSEPVVVLGAKEHVLNLRADKTVNYAAGMLTLEGVGPEDQVVWECSNVNPAGALYWAEDGYVHIMRKGSAVATAKVNGAEAAKILVDAENVPPIEEIRIFIEDEDVTGGTYTVEGSEEKKLQVQARYAGGTDFESVSMSGFAIAVSDVSMIYNMPPSGAFHFQKAGTGTITVTSKENPAVKASLTVTSEFVPVQSVKLAAPGMRELHGRNANSFTVGGSAFNPEPSSVTVTPSNATNADKFTITSSDESVAVCSTRPVEYTAFKKGTVRFTVSIEDTNPATGVTNTVTSTTDEITYTYKNPLTSVSLNGDGVQVKENEMCRLDLLVTGERSGEGYNVTEPGMVWTYSEDGIAKIEQGEKTYTWKRDESETAPDRNQWLAFPEFLVYGLSAGTVEVTGTPADDTNNAEPVKFTITVAPGDAAAPDLSAMSDKGAGTSIAYLNQNKTTNKYNDEWTIYALLRAGQSISGSDKDSYYASASKKIAGWGADVKPTDAERVALALSILGKDITDVDGVNLAAVIYNSTKLAEGSNELIYALIALDARNTAIPKDAKWTRERIIDALIDGFQAPDGGIGLNDNSSGSIDLTAMALQALARYEKTNARAASAIAKGLEFLKKKNTSVSCDFGTSEATAQVLMALTVLKRDPANTPGLGNAHNNTLTALMNRYYVETEEEGNGFKHVTSDEAPNDMATTQVLEALTAYQLYCGGGASYWELEKPSEPGTDPDESLSNEEKAAQVEAQIAALGKITVESEAAVKAARKAYNALTASQKELVKNYAVLEDAELAIAQLKGETVKTTLTVIGDTAHGAADHTAFEKWLNNYTVESLAGAKAGWVIRRALRANGYEPDGYDDYIAGITTPDGVRLAEFTNGRNSGWMYTVNGVKPDIGVDSYKVKDGDQIVLLYTDNYTDEHGWDKKVTKKPTCTESGEALCTCAYCGITKKEVLPAAGHKFGGWTVTEKATVFAPESQERICSVCGVKETRTSGTKLKPTIKLNVKSIPLKVRQSTTKVKVSGLANGDYIKSWKSSNTKIVKVSKKGKITAGKKKGKATVTVTLASGKKAKIRVNVQKSSVKTTKISGLTKKLTLHRKQKKSLKPVIYPITSKQKVTYRSSNKKVATVSSKGLVKAKSAGKTKITVQSGKKKVTVTVTVKK